MNMTHLILPESWCQGADASSISEFRIDHKRITDNLLEETKEKALSMDLHSIKQLVLWCRHNISRNKVEHWIPFFEKLNLRDSVAREFYLKGYLMNHSGDMLRSRAFKSRELYAIANHAILRNYVFDSFVDYETLKTDGYYARLTYELNPTTLEEETFKKSLILTRYYLEGNVPQMRKWSEALSRYPIDSNYFPIIKGRVWAARFLNQALKTGAVQHDLVQDWFESLKQESTDIITQLVMEPLPILVKFSNDNLVLEEIIEFISHITEVNLLKNPMVASLENAVILACKTAFYSRTKQIVRSQEMRQKLMRNSCLQSYNSYIQDIANSF